MSVAQTDGANKIGALLLIDSLCQNVGEPYISYFSNSMGKVRSCVVQRCACCTCSVSTHFTSRTLAGLSTYLLSHTREIGHFLVQMYREVWTCAGQTTRDRLMRWVAHHHKLQIFPPDVLAAMKAAVSDGAVQQSDAPAGKATRDPRRARPGPAAPPPGTALYLPAHAAAQPVPTNAPPAYHPAYGMPPPQAAPPQWHAQTGYGMPHGSMPPPPQHMQQQHLRPQHGMPMPAQRGAPGADPLAQYRAAQSAYPAAYGAPPAPHVPQAKPLSTTFKGVRLQVRLVVCHLSILDDRTKGSGLAACRAAGLRRCRQDARCARSRLRAVVQMPDATDARPRLLVVRYRVYHGSVRRELDRESVLGVLKSVTTLGLALLLVPGDHCSLTAHHRRRLHASVVLRSIVLCALHCQCCGLCPCPGRACAQLCLPLLQ